MPPDSNTHRTTTPGRLIVFADAVVAIAITLLALDLPVPSGTTASQLWSAVRDQESHYVAFLTSFAAIALAWTQHHRIWSFAARSDHRQQTLTMGWLLTIVMIPFATKLLRSSDDQTLGAHAIRFGFYAFLQCAGYLSLAVVAWRMSKLAMTRTEITPGDVRAAYVPSISVSVGFGLSIPVFFLTSYAWVLWWASPLAFAQLRRFRARRM